LTQLLLSEQALAFFQVKDGRCRAGFSLGGAPWNNNLLLKDVTEICERAGRYSTLEQTKDLFSRSAEAVVVPTAIRGFDSVIRLPWLVRFPVFHTTLLFSTLQRIVFMSLYQ
jgi:hypothetical protein